MKLAELNYRLKLRHTLKQATIEQLKWTKEETTREIMARCNKKGK